MFSRRTALLLLAPATLLVGIVFIGPFLVLVAMSFWSQPPGSLLLDTTPTLENYIRIFTDDLYLRGLWTTVWLSAATTAVCAIVGLPLAYFIVNRSGRMRALIMALLLVPLVTGALLPTLGLVNLLSTLGVVNSVLKSLGLISSALPLLGNAAGILIGLVQAFLPLMVLPLATVLDKLPSDYEAAAMSLGAGRIAVWRHIVLPLAVPGLVAGGLLVFCAALTSFVTPQILGQGKIATFATMAYQQASLVLDWPFASALAVTMLLLLGLITGLAAALRSALGTRAAT